MPENNARIVDTDWLPPNKGCPEEPLPVDDGAEVEVPVPRR